MKMCKKILLLFIALINLGCNSWEPEPTVYFDKIKENWQEEFRITNENNWIPDNELIKFANVNDEKGKLTVYSDKIPTQREKLGYIMTEISMSADFSSNDSTVIWGIQFGNKNALDKEQIFLGVNGKGEIMELDGEFNALSFSNNSARKKEVIREDKVLSKEKIIPHHLEMIKLSFHFYRNPYGWVIFYNFKDSNNNLINRDFINHIPFELLSGDVKEITVVAINRNKICAIWFKNWKIFNDWTPND